jgi:hypothetical protein
MLRHVALGRTDVSDNIPEDTILPASRFLLCLCSYLLQFTTSETWLITENICRIIMMLVYFNSIHKNEVSEAVWYEGNEGPRYDVICY